MRIGRLRHRIAFQTRAAGDDSHGQPTGAWTTQFTVWGAVEDASSREQLRGGVSTALTDTVITIRHRTDITADMRAVVDGTRTLEVIGLGKDPEGRGRMMQIPAREQTP